MKGFTIIGMRMTIEVCREVRVVNIIGGFHLFEEDFEAGRMDQTISYLRDLNLVQIHPCHCTFSRPKIALAQVCKL